MLFRLAQKLLLGVAFFLCFPTLAGQYPDQAKSNRTTITVNIVWLPNFNAVNAICSFLMRLKDDGLIVGCYDPSTQTIYAVEPRNFDDKLRLEILGHEFWHALGAEHPVL